jgi:hypothetical protein
MMIRRSQWFSRVLAMAAAALMAAPSAASAQSDARRASFDLFGAYVRPVDSDADADTEAFGLRGGYRFTGPWALEGSLSRLNEDVDLWFADLSAKAYFVHHDRFEVYALAGPGIFRVSEGDFEEDETTVHVGLGAEIGLGERAFLRPEVRGRWLADELIFDDGIADYSLGFGWRF